jgi:hypothetical protein
MWPYCYKNDSYYDTINKENEENGKKNQWSPKKHLQSRVLKNEKYSIQDQVKIII